MKAIDVAMTLVILGGPVPALAQSVGIAGSGLGCAFTSVDVAAGLAAPGQTLYPKSGTVFIEAVDLNKDVTLRAGGWTWPTARPPTGGT